MEVQETNIDLSNCKPIYYHHKYYYRYLVNSNGTIIFDTKHKRLVKLQTRSSHKIKTKLFSNATQYNFVRLVLDGVAKQIRVHQLVKWTFIGRTRNRD